MLCFADSYTVETWKDGKCNTYDIAVSKGDSPFKILKHSTDDKAGHGTRISTFVLQSVENPCYCVKQQQGFSYFA